MSTARAYDVVAPAYDLLTAGYAYGPWLAAIDRLAREHGLRGHRALDVACGTGKSLEALLDLGYDAAGCDGSAGMAAVARRKLAGRAHVFVADMCSLGIAGTFDLVTCLDDALNHLPSAADVVRALRAMGGNLACGGLLAFDVNTLGAYRDVGDRIVEHGDQIVLWHGGPARLAAPGGRAEVAMDVMRSCGDGLWRRERASWGHWHYPLASIPSLVDEAGLEVVAVRGQLTGGRLEPDADEERHRKAVFLARRRFDPSEGGDHALAAVDR
ncbi:MAG TPA: class I SAM-dependent methyltransferase [Solirubrobacteraceae bacterium]|nr:class I SAM-dependent methyltransferase [Solirubrobacteraceae bacterium]